MSSYNHPPGRPQATPPGLFDKLQQHPLVTKPVEEGAPPRKEGEDNAMYQLRLNQWRRQNDATYREAWDENKANSVRSSYQKAQVKALNECRKRNRTETRGIWTTNRVYARSQKLDPEIARSRLNREAIEKFRIDGVMCYLIHVARPAETAEPAPVQAEPAPKPQRLGAVNPTPPTFGRRVVQVHIAISRKEIEEKLIELLSLKSPVFQWDGGGNVNITSEE